ncbi:MAG TPA: hypothetical protein VFB22_03020 [Candidatus Baltobacteraceae bacterium]|nr:hypothetical protein [Candidatus Baltobacteraceae bacterium]
MIGAESFAPYVFLLAFASSFLLWSKRPVLAASTRVLLVVLLTLAVAYGASNGAWYRGYVGVAALIANALFVAFAGIDFLAWQKRRLAGDER